MSVGVGPPPVGTVQLSTQMMKPWRLVSCYAQQHAGDYDGVFPQGDGYIATCQDDTSLCIPTFIASDGWKLQAMMKTHNAQLPTSLLPLGTESPLPSFPFGPLPSTSHLSHLSIIGTWPTVYLYTVYQWF